MRVKSPKAPDERLFHFMDMLNHDVVNNNQAVLGYLELILASGGIDRNVRKYAEKAVSHIRTSTILVDNMKRMMLTRGMGAAEFKPVDLTRTMNSASREVELMFPDKRITVKLPSAGPITVVGDGGAADLVLNMMVSMVRLDEGQTVNLTLRASEASVGGKKCWQLVLEDKQAQMPKMAKDKPIEAALLEDTSIAVKMAGMLYCRIMAETLGGSFEARAPGAKGAAFVATLSRAGEP